MQLEDGVLILKSIRVKNFRSIRDETLNCDNLTALVGANGSGKSSFLHAIKIFQSKLPKIDEEDYYDKNTSEDIEIAVTFKDLSESAKKLFASYIQNNELTVEQIIKWNGVKSIPKFHGSTLQNSDFAEIFNESATKAKEKYDELKKSENYKKFLPWTSQSKIKEFLKNWESQNPNKCKRLRDEGQFFGFSEVGQGYLGRFVRFLYIPAVHDAASDALEVRNSVLTELMDLAVRKSLAEKEEIKKFQEDTKKRYAEVMDTSKLKELEELEKNMTTTLQNFVPDAKIDLKWQSLNDLKIDLPKAEANLVEDGYHSKVDKTGHGLQRAFIMTILQHLSAAQARSTRGTRQPSDESPTLIFVIEEPELYQHPSRQRHLAEVFLSLAKGEIPGVSDKTQIVYSTHSPYFVGIDRINQIRLLRKIPASDAKPKTTKIFSTDLQEVIKNLEQVFTSIEFTEDGLKSRLQRIMTPWMNEGFFSDVVVLVEGEDDRASIIGTAKSLEHTFESMGISVIPCFGKTSLDKPTIIFRQLGIPVYVVWDGDKGKGKAKENHNLLSLMGKDVEDWPSMITDTFACFEKYMQVVLKNEIGPELFEKYMNECENDFLMKRDQAIKNPTVIYTIIKKARENGHSCKTLEMIVQKIVDLKK